MLLHYALPCCTAAKDYMYTLHVVSGRYHSCCADNVCVAALQDPAQDKAQNDYVLLGLAPTLQTAGTICHVNGDKLDLALLTTTREGGAVEKWPLLGVLLLDPATDQTGTDILTSWRAEAGAAPQILNARTRKGA